MRNFSSTSNVDFESSILFAADSDRYVSDINVQKVVLKLAEVFETDVQHVKGAWNSVILGKDYDDMITCSEYRVLEELYEFALFVQQSIRENGSKFKTRAFTYFNLNTGKSVVWVHYIC
jgi:hypothetical protein